MQTVPTLRLKVEPWLRDCSKAGLANTFRARAEHIGMSHVTVHRIEAGASPSDRFIASVLIAFHPRKFERYFEVVTQR